MRDHESAMLCYIRLADVSQRKRQLLGRDKLLVLAAAAACRAGWPDVAERCRQLVLEHNPAHLLKNFSTVADALRSDDFASLLKQHERMCGYERAEFLVNELDLQSDRPPAKEGQTAGQLALELLSPSSPSR
jgi:hypothetical protein